MKTFSVSIALSPDQVAALNTHIQRQTTSRPGPNPGDVLTSQIYPNIEAFLADQFASSIMHLIPMSLSSEAAVLKLAAEEAQRLARAAQVSLVQVADAQ